MSATDVISLERLEALLRGDAPRTADEARRHALLDELRGAALRAPEELRSRALSAAPSPRRVGVPRPSRRLALIVLPAALVLAVLAAVVHGFTGSNGPVVNHGVSAAKAPSGEGTVTVQTQQSLAGGTDRAGSGGFRSAVP